MAERDVRDDGAAGLECSACGCAHWYVVRTEHGRARIVRTRECRNCGRRVRTVEKVRPDGDDGK